MLGSMVRRGGEPLVVLEALLGQIEGALVYQRRHGNVMDCARGVSPLRACPAPRGPISHAYGTAAATLSSGLLRLAEAGRAAIRRVAQHPPDGRALPAGLLLTGGHAQLVEPPGDRADAQPLHGVQIVDLADYFSLSLVHLEVGRALLGLAHVAVAVRRSAQNAGLALLGTVPLAAPRALQDLGTLVFGDHALELQQQLVFRRMRLRCVDEDRLHALAQPFLRQQDLVGVLAAEPIGRQHQHRLDLAFGDEVAHALQARANQRRAAEALVLEDPFIRYAVAVARSERHQRGGLAGNRLVLLLLIRGHSRIDRCCLHAHGLVLLLGKVYRCAESGPEPRGHRPARPWRSTNGQSNTRDGHRGAGAAQARPRSRAIEARDCACHHVADRRACGLRVRAQLRCDLLGHFDGDRHARRHDRHRPLDRLGLLHVPEGLPARQAKCIGQHVRGLRDRATLGKQIECSVQALGPFGAGGSRHWP